MSKSQWFFCGLIFYFLNTSFLSSNMNQNVSQEPGNSGDVPTPFGFYNKKFELVHGEFYILQGTVKEFMGQHYLEINTKVQPYLSRKKNEKIYYLLKNYINQPTDIPVTITVIAEDGTKTRPSKSKIILHFLKKFTPPQKNDNNQKESYEYDFFT